MQNQQLDEKQLQALLRLKRYEQPPQGYFDNLLDRVHQRQREEMLRRPAWQIALERIRAFFAPLQLDWRHASSMAALLVAGIFAIRIAIPDRAADSLPVAQSLAASAQPVSPPIFTLAPNGAQPLIAQEKPRLQRDPDAPIRFVIDAQPVSFSYETTQNRF